MARWVMNPSSVHEDVGLVPGLAQWVKELALLWLWCRPIAAALFDPCLENFHMPQGWP